MEIVKINRASELIEKYNKLKETFDFLEKHAKQDQYQVNISFSHKGDYRHTETILEDNFSSIFSEVYNLLKAEYEKTKQEIEKL